MTEGSRRSLELLWRVERSRTRGPKPTLTLDDVVDVAIAITDRDGLDALSMRTLARELRCSPMSLYTYVSTRGELLELMYDAVLSELLAEGAGADGSVDTWRVRVRELARSWWALYLRHPWVLHLTSPRSMLGPNEFAATEALLAALDGLRLPAVDIVLAAHTITSFVRGAARNVIEARQAEAGSGISDEAWWAERGALLSSIAGDLAQRFPVLTRLQQEGGFAATSDDEDGYLANEAIRAFDFGLERVLDGLDAHVAAAQNRPGTTSQSAPKPRKGRGPRPK